MQGKHTGICRLQRYAVWLSAPYTARCQQAKVFGRPLVTACQRALYSKDNVTSPVSFILLLYVAKIIKSLCVNMTQKVAKRERDISFECY